MSSPKPPPEREPLERDDTAPPRRARPPSAEPKPPDAKAPEAKAPPPPSPPAAEQPEVIARPKTVVGVRLMASQYKVVTVHRREPSVFRPIQMRKGPGEGPRRPSPRSKSLRPKGQSSSSRLGVVSILLLSAAAAGAVVFVLEREKAPSHAIASKVRRFAPLKNELVLDVSPPEAVVVGEEDGRILGRPPLKFRVPARADIAVLIAAKGKEPVRLVLPERGRVSIDLLPLGNPDLCDIDIDAPAGAALEAVEGSLEKQKKYHLTGVALVRAPNVAGAWIVRCPTMGGEPRPKLTPFTQVGVQLAVTAPKGELLYSGDLALGPVPAERKMTPGFIPLKVGPEAKTEWWLPLFSDTEVELPAP